MNWTNFYVAAAAAAATLVGLLFVAVQLSIDSFQEGPGNRRRAVASSTFTIFTLLFILPMILLLPDLGNSARGTALLILAAVGAWRSIQTWLPFWRGCPHQRTEQLWQTPWLLVGPILAYLALGRASYSLSHGDESSAVFMSIGIVQLWLFAVALRNSWGLLFEAQDQAGRDGTPMSREM